MEPGSTESRHSIYSDYSTGKHSHIEMKHPASFLTGRAFASDDALVEIVLL